MKKLMVLVVMVAMMGITSISLPARVMAEEGGAKNVCSDDNIPEDLRKQAGCEVKEGALSNTAINLINTIIAVIGLIAVVVIVIAGIMYATSLGEPGKMTQAKNMILYAVIALIVAVMAWGIVQVVVASVPTLDAKGSAETG